MAEPIHVVCPVCDSVNRLPPERDPKAAKCGRCKNLLFQGKPVALDTARFHKHLAGSGIPLIVDFWAGWCGPCRAMAPVFDQAAQTLEPAARFVKVDVDAEGQLAAEYGVRGHPGVVPVQGWQGGGPTRGRGRPGAVAALGAGLTHDVPRAGAIAPT